MGDVDRARRASELTGVHRFFVSPEAIQQGVVRFTESQAHQFAHVLRLRPGDQIIALDNSGWQYVVELVQVDATRAVGQVKTKMLAQTEPRTKITLYQA
ncbi:MAG: 16S rRNA (uracil(1498)-N(3))-methyltransferase, partial [Chloroflexi bacterium]|nr:16S rRNA (uracil(1498)-N(3))-methyltransferase [Chloroflexota bacterium]